MQYREALQPYAEFAKERLAPADTHAILGQYAKMDAQRTPLKLE